MDILKQDLLSEETGGRNVFNRSEIEQKRIQKRRGEEKRDADAKRLCQNQNQNQNPSDPNSSSSPNFKLDSKPESGVDSSSKATISDEQKLKLPKQAVTLFGESDDDLLDQLNYVLQAGLFDLDDNTDMTEGQTNDFLRDIVELKRKVKYGVGGEDGDDGMDQDKNMKSNFRELSDEDKIIIFFMKLLIEWYQELDQMTETEKMTANGKFKLATFKKCVRYLNPLFNFCRKKVLHHDIRQALMLLVNCCMKRDYYAAFNHYIQIATRKSACLIDARGKIHTITLAHVLNDETTRKYLTSAKRLMTFCYRRHPGV